MRRDVGAKVPGGEGVLVGGVAADDHDGFGGGSVVLGGGFVSLAAEGLGEGDVVRCAVMVDVVGLED